MRNGQGRTALKRGGRATLLAASLILTLVPQAQAESGVLQTHCRPSHESQVDPIVNPGQMSMHLHDFFGNVTTTAMSTYASMVGQPTSCDVAGDSAGYWAPTLLNRYGIPIPIYRITVYYRDLPDQNEPVRAFPPDFKMIAGYPGPHLIDGPIKKGAYGWNCDNTEPLLASALIDCAGHPGDGRVKANIFFPNCGQLDANGNIVLDSVDHRSHVAYPVDGVCPPDHPVKLPTVYFKIKYSVTNCITAGCHLVSDEMMVGTSFGQSLHADLWNTWVQSALQEVVSGCLNGDNCKLPA